MSVAAVKFWLRFAAVDGHITRNEMKRALSQEDSILGGPVSIGDHYDSREERYVVALGVAAKRGATRTEMIGIAGLGWGDEGAQRTTSVTKTGARYIKRADIGLSNKDLPGLGSYVGIEEGALDELDSFLLSNISESGVWNSVRIGLPTAAGVQLGGPVGGAIGLSFGLFWQFVDD